MTQYKSLGELLPSGSVRGFHFNSFHAPIIHSMPLTTAWGERADLITCKPGSKSRQAHVYVRTYGRSQHWSGVVVVVRVPTNLTHSEAAHLAANKAHHRAVGYAWTMWARGRIVEKYASLDDEPLFKTAIRNITAEWMPRQSATGRIHIERVLGLGSFTASAFSPMQSV